MNTEKVTLQFGDISIQWGTTHAVYLFVVEEIGAIWQMFQLTLILQPVQQHWTFYGILIRSNHV